MHIDHHVEGVACGWIRCANLAVCMWWDMEGVCVEERGVSAVYVMELGHRDMECVCVCAVRTKK